MAIKNTKFVEKLIFLEKHLFNTSECNSKQNQLRYLGGMVTSLFRGGIGGCCCCGGLISVVALVVFLFVSYA